MQSKPRGKAVNQLEAPLTEAKSTAYRKDSLKFSRKAEDREENSSAFRLLVKSFLCFSAGFWMFYTYPCIYLFII